MNNDSAALDDRQTLEQVLESRGVPTRDCRDCSKFGADPAPGRAPTVIA